MKILALEFSSAQRSVAVVASGSRISEVVDTSARGTNALGMIAEALRQTGLEREQVEGIVVGLGPGSYTGIRAAIALAQGWQLARGTRLLGISSAEGIAAQAQTEGLRGSISIVIDAQRHEFYLALYEISASDCRELEPLRLATLAEVQERERAGGILAGPDPVPGTARGRIIFPRAAMLARLAGTRSDFVAGEKLEPIYLRETSFVKAPPPRIL